ncbi:MAG: HD domain-containing protein [Geobacter sp.]|nr:HD domain-containing protein [Geobacter sp.]
MDSSKNGDRPLYNSRIIDTYIRLIKQSYTYVNVGDLLDYAGMKGYEVADEAHWFTQEQVNRFYEKLASITGNDNIAREAGRYAASPDALGVMRQYVLGLIGASNAFDIISKTTANFTRSSRYESRKLSSNKVEITVTPLENVSEQPFQCENRIGFFEAIVLIFNRKIPDAKHFPHVEHDECIFKGGAVCRYVITWEKSLSVILRKLRNILIILLSVLNLILLIMRNWTVLEESLLASLILVMVFALVVEKSEKAEIQSSLSNTKESNFNLLNQININYNNALMTNEISQALGRYTISEDILDNVMRIMEKRLDFSRGMILMANSDNTRLVMANCYGYDELQLRYLRSWVFHLGRPGSEGVFLRAFRELRPFLVNDLNSVDENLSPSVIAFARKLGTQSFICCPVICNDNPIGVITVDNVKTKRPLVESDVSLLMGIASMIGISIRNGELIGARERVFKSILQVLAASIDARDSLTAGHSEKVTEYSVAICREVGFTTDYCEMIRVAALLHDYGKISVPDNILKKVGTLTPEEYDVIKTHATKTREILKKIDFEGIYSETPEIAGAHHEKMDGSGYPLGMKGADIPVGARIIAVADYFESITSRRHYRDPMTIHDAFSLLLQECGTHLDKKFVDALIKYYNRTYPDNAAPT